MWYRGTPPSLEQTKGMPILVMNYSFGGGGGMTWIGVRNRSSIRRSLIFSSWSISTSLRRARYWSQNSSVTRSTSVTAGKELKSGIGGIAPCRLWEKARRALTDPTKVGFLTAGCSPFVDGIPFTSFMTLSSLLLTSSFSLGSWVSSSKGSLPLLLLLLETMVLLNLKTISGQKQLETKHDEKARYEPRGFGWVI